jgi:hypothetical protein
MGKCASMIWIVALSPISGSNCHPSSRFGCEFDHNREALSFISQNQLDGFRNIRMSIHFGSDASEFLRYLDPWISDIAKVEFPFVSAFAQYRAFDDNFTTNAISLFSQCVNDSVFLGLALLVFAQEFSSCAFACEKNIFAR